MNIIKDLDEIVNAVVAVDTTISVNSDGESFQWYKCDDYSNTNAQKIDGATTNELDVTQEEPKECYYYCLISKAGETTIPTKTCKVCTKAATDFLTHLAHDKDVLAAALAQLNGDNRDYNSMNYDQLVAEVMNLNLESGYTLPVASTTTLGGVKPDGSSITITNDGVISAVSSDENKLAFYLENVDFENRDFDLTIIDSNGNEIDIDDLEENEKMLKGDLYIENIPIPQSCFYRRYGVEPRFFDIFCFDFKLIKESSYQNLGIVNFNINMTYDLNHINIMQDSLNKTLVIEINTTEIYDNFDELMDEKYISFSNTPVHFYWNNDLENEIDVDEIPIGDNRVYQCIIYGINDAERRWWATPQMTGYYYNCSDALDIYIDNFLLQNEEDYSLIALGNVDIYRYKNWEEENAEWIWGLDIYNIFNQNNGNSNNNKPLFILENTDFENNEFDFSITDLNNNTLTINDLISGNDVEAFLFDRTAMAGVPSACFYVYKPEDNMLGITCLDYRTLNPRTRKIVSWGLINLVINLDTNEKQVMILPEEGGSGGSSKELRIGTVTTVSNDTPASASITTEGNIDYLNLNIPRGSTGATSDGTGDMLTKIYDTHEKMTDIFDYVDSKVGSSLSGGNSMIIDFNDPDKLFKKESRLGTISNITRTGNNWTKDTTKLDEDGLPMWKSNSISNSQSTTQKINFTTTENNQCVAINVYTSSENNYDWIYVSKLDSSFSTSNYTGKLSGIDKIDHFVVDIPNAGSHYINITYSKDYSASSGQDCVWYSIKNENNGVATVETEVLTNKYTDEMNEIFTKMLKSLEKGFWNGTCFKYNNNLYNIYISNSSSSNYYILDLGYIKTSDISISSSSDNIISYKRLYIYKNRTEFTSETAYLHNLTYTKMSISVPKCTASKEGVVTVDNITIKSNNGKISANSPIFIENDEFTDDIQMSMPENTIYCVIEEV